MSHRRILVGSLLGLVLLSACGMAKLSNEVSGESMGQNQAALAEISPTAPRGDMSDGVPGATSAAPSAAAMRRMIILTGSMTIEVDRFAEKAEALGKAIIDLGGYSSGSDERVDEAGRRYGTLTFRIPSEKWTEALAAARSLGKVLEESTRGEDVSEEYYDIEARLAADKKLEAELIKLLDASKRGRLSDLLEIEREIARVRGEIESKEGRMRYLANMASLSTLTVQLREPSALISVEPGALDPITEAIGESVSIFAGSLGALIVFAAAIVPWLILGWLIFLFVRWRWRRRKQ